MSKTLSPAAKLVFDQIDALTIGLSNEEIIRMKDTCAVDVSSITTDLSEECFHLLRLVRRFPKNPTATIDNAARLTNIAFHLHALRSHYALVTFVEPVAETDGSSTSSDSDTVVITPPDSPQAAEYTSTDEEGDGLVV